MIKLSPKKPVLLLKQYSDKNIQNFPLLLILLFIFASLFIYQGCKINKNNIEDIRITSKLIENRSLLKGWILPENIIQNVFEEKLETHLIYNQQEAETLLSSMKFYRTQGKLEAISSINYDENIVLIAYYLWRPLKGNPLLIEKFEIINNIINAYITLDNNNIGKEYPFLLAPIHVASISKSNITNTDTMQILFNGTLNNTMTLKK